jgi:glycosyltransferase involved in cell wall biosynthesis
MSILVPFRDSDGSRSHLINYLRPRWESSMPDAEIIVAEDDGESPFSKTIAVNNAFRQSTSDVIVILDADCWVEPDILRRAAKVINTGKAPWVRPCNKVNRINQRTTDRLLGRAAHFGFPTITSNMTERITPVVGLVCVVPRTAFLKAGGMDPRFRGWGWEDTAWNWMIDGIHGKAQIWNYSVNHLWHPRKRSSGGRPVWEGQTERNATLGRRYKTVRSNPHGLRKLASEVQKITDIRPETAV